MCGTHALNWRELISSKVFMSKTSKILAFVNKTIDRKFPVQWLGTAAAVGLILLAVIIFIPRCQVASLKQDVTKLRNPKLFIATQDIIVAEKARLDAETAARSALIQGIGLIIITGYFSWLNYRSNQKKQSEDRYYKALEDLRSDYSYIRVNGINVLEQYIKDEKQHTQKVLNVLANYIREKSPHLPNSENQESFRISADIQDAMKVIAFSDRTYEGSETHHIDLTGTNLCRLILEEKANLKGINFEQSNLQLARLPKANFEGARLRNTKFESANLDGVNFERATLVFARFDRASLTSAIFEGAKAEACHWTEAKLKNANFKNAVCTSAKFLKADLKNVDFQGAKLDWAKFGGAKNITKQKIAEQASSYEQITGLND